MWIILCVVRVLILPIRLVAILRSPSGRNNNSLSSFQSKQLTNCHSELVSNPSLQTDVVSPSIKSQIYILKLRTKSNSPHRSKAVWTFRRVSNNCWSVSWSGCKAPFRSGSFKSSIRPFKRSPQQKDFWYFLSLKSMEKPKFNCYCNGDRKKNISIYKEIIIYC